MLLSLSASSVQCPLLSLCFCTNAIRNGKRRPKHTHTTPIGMLSRKRRPRDDRSIRCLNRKMVSFKINASARGKWESWEREKERERFNFSALMRVASRRHTTFWWINEFNASTGSHLAFSHFLFSSKQRDELREFQFIRSQLTHSPSLCMYLCRCSARESQEFYLPASTRPSCARALALWQNITVVRSEIRECQGNANIYTYIWM